MNLSKTVLVIASFLFICGCNNTYRYLRTSKQRLQQQSDNQYLQVSLSELRRHISKNQTLYYIGTDSNFHYLVIYYDKLAKMTMGFKLPKTEFTPKEVFLFQNDYFLKKQPTSLSEM